MKELLLKHIDDRIQFHTKRQKDSGIPEFHSGAMIELVDIKRIIEQEC
jgi:hypothetical protein